jgi:hypothetical protein
LSAEASALVQVGVAFLWAGARRASIIKLALSLVHCLSGWQKAHAEFEYESALLETGLIGSSKSVPVDRGSSRLGPAEMFAHIWDELLVALVFSDGPLKIASNGCAAKEELYLAAWE